MAGSEFDSQKPQRRRWWRRQRSGADPALQAQLREAASGGVLSQALDALATGASPDPAASALEEESASPLMLAARAGHLVVVEALLDAGADPNRMAGGETPLIWALHPELAPASSRAAAVRLLVARGADLEGSDADGLSPLMRAVLDGGGQVELVELLLDLGADASAKHPAGLTVLDLAERDPGKAALARVLRAGGARSGAAAAPRPITRLEDASTDEATPISERRGLGCSAASEVVLLIKGEADRVGRAFEGQRGATGWRRQVLGPEGLEVEEHEEGVLLYQLRGHAWTLLQTPLLDARSLRSADAQALSAELDCDAILYEVCDASELIAYCLYRAGRPVERFEAAASAGQGAAFESRFQSELRSVEPDELDSPIDFVHRSLAAHGAYVPGIGDDYLTDLAGEFAGEELERVDFLELPD